MKNLKVAFCFSGQLREWEYCSENWIKFANMFETPPDIFTHFWNFNTNSQRFIPMDNSYTPISKDEIEKYLNTFNPKKYLIEEHDILEKINQNFNQIRFNKKLLGTNITNPNIWMMHQFYSVYRSYLLKKEYEMENNFQYDICFRLRNDVFFPEYSMERIFEFDLSNQFNKQTLYVIHSYINGFAPNRIGDLFYFGNSHIFDIVSNFYIRLPTINIKDNGFSPENYFAYYIRSMEITYKDTILPMQVVRGGKHKALLEKYNLNPYGIDLII